jgi:hypothetical protein
MWSLVLLIGGRLVVAAGRRHVPVGRRIACGGGKRRGKGRGGRGRECWEDGIEES